MATYETGDRIEITTSTAFQDTGGTPLDPDVVTFEVRNPSTGTTTTYTYGVDGEVTKNGTGDYTCTIDVEAAGTWHYKIRGETSGGQNRGAADGSFYVQQASV